ncbi:YcxB family protein [Oscillospiraceae bacterium MB08-C2-2]|nr:YcxB family protein [Oscillospiraceae bacterium MB08-C2-2]
MTFHYRNSYEDFIQFNLYNSDHSDSMQAYIRIVQFGMAIVFLVFYYLSSMIITTIPAVAWLIFYLVVTVLWIVFYPTLRRKSTVRRLKKIIAAGHLKGFEGERSISFQEEGLVATGGEKGEARLKYSGVTRIGTQEGSVYIFVGNKNAFILPAGAFTAEEERQALLDLLKSRTKAEFISEKASFLGI